ncbi:polysaccharide pyruvyl transferase family protein [Brevibacterium samyangense]|uniref:Polysaccharide pyruvyl transferase family protein n=1 Tax=Brevibacterium samyangense TaxID=366888 RepID=A0ABP5F4D9_9MICO
MRVGFAIFDAATGQSYAGLPDRLGISYEEITRAVTPNSGNLAFKYAAGKLVGPEVVYFNFNDDPLALRDQVDAVVLAEANLVNPQVNYAKPARFIKQLDRPVFLCGVGAQANIETDPEQFPTIPTGTLSFLQEVSSRTDAILVRGEFTESVLKRLGITNVQAVGCPSLLINSDRKLWETIGTKNRQNSLMERPTVTEGVYPAAKRTPTSDKAERLLFQLVRFMDADFVGQSQILIRKIGFGYADEVRDEDLGKIARYLAPGANLAEVRATLRSNSRAFARVDEWVSYLRSRTSVIGSRIHGNMMGIQAGIPSMPVVHDSRTLELCETMGIPYTTIRKVSSLDSVDNISSVYDGLFSADLKSLDKRRLEIAAVYSKVLSSLGIQPSSHLSILAD